MKILTQVVNTSKVRNKKIYIKIWETLNEIYHFPIIEPKIRSCLSLPTTSVKESFFSPFKFHGRDEVDSSLSIEVEYGKLSVLEATRLCPKTFVYGATLELFVRVREGALLKTLLLAETTEFMACKSGWTRTELCFHKQSTKVMQIHWRCK